MISCIVFLKCSPMLNLVQNYLQKLEDHFLNNGNILYDRAPECPSNFYHLIYHLKTQELCLFCIITSLSNDYLHISHVFTNCEYCYVTG